VAERSDKQMKIVIQRAWASVMGVASATIRILKFGSIVHIPTLDALIHIITGLILSRAPGSTKGNTLAKTNRYLGIFYIVFGVIGINWAHIIAGIISILIGLLT
jgi:hypothetical protein